MLSFSNGIVEWTGNGTDTFDIDIDQNGINDVSFYQYAWNSSGSEKKELFVKTRDSVAMELELVTYYYDSLDWVNSVVISDSGLILAPKLYSDYDTIFPFVGDTGAKIAEWQWLAYPTPHKPFQINALNNQEGYFAIRKTISGVDYYGWIKVYVVSSGRMHIYHVAFDGFIMINSVKEETSQALEIYPNPSTDIVRITGASIQSLSVFDLAGKLVTTEKHNSKPVVEIDVHDWPPGLYVIHCTHSKGTSTMKLLKN